MDQPTDITPPETLDEIMDAVTKDDRHRMVSRGDREPVMVMSIPACWRLRLGPAPQWMQDGWAKAEEAGLHKMTMDEIDAEIAAARRETMSAAAPR